MIGRKTELENLLACVQSGRSVLLEGPVGVGKTHLALSVTQTRQTPFFRIDGDSRYTEQKLVGFFDPPMVLKKGFTEESFIDGPLVEAMKTGGILFINELNRLPEGVQNVLLPAIDEKIVSIPRLGVVQAKKGFLVLATQNPKEFVATSHLSEAILDRFELITMDYQTEAEEVAIVLEKVVGSPLAQRAVTLVRGTRHHPKIKRGASVRAAIAIADLSAALIDAGKSPEEAFQLAVMMALPTRIELDRNHTSDKSLADEMKDLIAELLVDTGNEKKK